MPKYEILTLIKQKRSIMDSFLYTINISSNFRESHKESLHSALTATYLKAVILELILKILCELDTKKQAPFTHDLQRVFNLLNMNTKNFLTESYSRAVCRRQSQFKTVDPTLEFPPLKEILRSNADIVKNFKYGTLTSGFKNASSDNVFYKELFDFIDKKIDGFSL